MPASGNRRPFPAIAFLLILSLIAAVVWWRVLHRADQSSSAHTTNSSCNRPAGNGTATPLPTASRIKVTVLNGNGRSGLAAAVGNQLKARGFKSVTVGNDSPVSGIGEVRYAPAYAASATVLHAYFPGTTLVPRPTTPAGVTISLGSQYRAMASAAQVRAALVKASTAPAPTC